LTDVSTTNWFLEVLREEGLLETESGATRFASRTSLDC
jgi:hypothetical protein